MDFAEDDTFFTTFKVRNLTISWESWCRIPRFLQCTVRDPYRSRWFGSPVSGFGSVLTIRIRIQNEHLVFYWFWSLLFSCVPVPWHFLVRIRIREAQKRTDPDPVHCPFSWAGSAGTGSVDPYVFEPPGIRIQIRNLFVRTGSGSGSSHQQATFSPQCVVSFKLFLTICSLYQYLYLNNCRRGLDPDIGAEEANSGARRTAPGAAGARSWECPPFPWWEEQRTPRFPWWVTRPPWWCRPALPHPPSRILSS